MEKKPKKIYRHLLTSKQKQSYANKKIKHIYRRWALNRNNLVFIDQFSYSKYDVM